MNRKMIALLALNFLTQASYSTHSNTDTGFLFCKEIFGDGIFFENIHHQNLDPQRYAILFFVDDHHHTQYPRIRSIINKLRGLFLIY